MRGGPVLVLGLLLPALAACGEERAPAPPSAETAGVPTGILLPEDGFPALDPFRSGPWWPHFAVHDRDPARFAAEIRALPETMAHQAAVIGREAGPLPRERAVGVAELGPRIPFERRFLYAMSPSLLAALEPLWGRAEWTEGERSLAREAAALFHRHLGAPEVAFPDGDVAGSAASLDRLAAWFRGEVARADRYAAMIFTLDDGPFVGLECDGLPERTPVVRTLRGDLRVEARETGPEDARTAVLAARRGTETLWCRRLTSGEGRPLERVRVGDLPADDLGPYGWRLHLSAGGEHVHVYLAPDGRFLFYFVSW